MATRLPEFRMRQLSRRSGSDITRLAAVYKSQSDALTSQYETEFDKYQKNVAATMAPYQAQVEQFKATVQPQYQSALDAYNQRLTDYQRQLAEINANPVTERIERVVVGRNWRGKKKWGDAYFYDPKPIPTFEEKAPDIPNAPVAPQVEQFNSTQIEEKRKQMGSDFQREVSERKSSRMAAVQRRSRTLLSGA
jgi:hypothetical protein